MLKVINLARLPVAVLQALYRLELIDRWSFEEVLAGQGYSDKEIVVLRRKS